MNNPKAYIGATLSGVAVGGAIAVIFGAPVAVCLVIGGVAGFAGMAFSRRDEINDIKKAKRKMREQRGNLQGVEEQIIRLSAALDIAEQEIAIEEEKNIVCCLQGT
eukprot:TRINITY_DN6545_c0_g1_i1.p2 TRINITY_DN6545_c0_g1~~TRINITY_DN6545_c0_g1_i1.p2  ORF type:complete len:106 (-),score=19.87 TRINITY_DN6545_c0_g1_i1:206-523(-)